mmetsp:Transcript_59342/g.174187  ORF Transcript_59342/g.174187 Transcript_59342/m.174187 type:complete len:330 (-) Transcript_59342:695-1684(-)
MASICSGERARWSLVTVMTSLESELLSSARTLRMPSAPTSKVTSICGWPRGAGAMPPSRNFPRKWLLRVSERSPSKTWMSRAGWLSRAVVKIVEFLVGNSVFLSISLVITPPTVLMPSVRGVTSSSVVTPVSRLPRVPARTAAPCATASSGLMPRAGALPPNASCTSCWTFGMRVEPPTSRTSSTSDAPTPASFRTPSASSMVLSKRSRFSSSNRALESVPEKESPSKSASRLMRACGAELSIRFAFSASCWSLCSAALSPDGSFPCFFSNALARYRTTRWSKSQPPRRASPAVATTSKESPAARSRETSKVPPPRSKTKTVFAFPSRP